jgi:hypothetical protein
LGSEAVWRRDRGCLGAEFWATEMGSFQRRGSQCWFQSGGLEAGVVVGHLDLGLLGSVGRCRAGGKKFVQKFMLKSPKYVSVGE